jgi:UDP-N-acetylglucosamine:LPS N-acetylglucosamine transferase
MNDDEKCKTLSEIIKSLAKPDATQKIVDEAEKMIRK